VVVFPTGFDIEEYRVRIVALIEEYKLVTKKYILRNE